MARSEAETKKLVPEKFHEWIKVFGKKQLERMPMKKVWDHKIDVKKGFVQRKGKVLSQTSFSLYLHNQWTDFHKLSCAGKP